MSGRSGSRCPGPLHYPPLTNCASFMNVSCFSAPHAGSRLSYALISSSQMASVQPTQRPPPLFAKLLRLDNPIRSLTVAFWLWKILLYIVVNLCPGPGYDTSTSLLSYVDSTATGNSESLSGPLKFARWDSIYFLDIAEKGYTFEQQWAFGYPKILGLFVSGIDSLLRRLSI